MQCHNSDLPEIHIGGECSVTITQQDSQAKIRPQEAAML